MIIMIKINWYMFNIDKWGSCWNKPRDSSLHPACRSFIHSKLMLHKVFSLHFSCGEVKECASVKEPLWVWKTIPLKLGRGDASILNQKKKIDFPLQCCGVEKPLGYRSLRPSFILFVFLLCLVPSCTPFSIGQSLSDVSPAVIFEMIYSVVSVVLLKYQDWKSNFQRKSFGFVLKRTPVVWRVSGS